MPRKKLEEEKVERLTIALTPSTRKILDAERGNVQRSIAVRVLINTLAAHPGYIAEVLRTSKAS